jgi:DNA processing protein
VSLESLPDAAITADVGDDAAYWLAFSSVPYIGPARIERLVHRFGTLRAAWDAPTEALRAVLDARPLSALLATRGRSDPRQKLEHLRALGIAVAHPGGGHYPRLLAEISGRPPVLFIRGTLTISDEEPVAVVGTRRATPYGRQAAERIARELAEAGVTVVSGLARGVDAAAHRAALSAGGRTIAVLGSGPDVIYPPDHRKLAEEILEAGAIVSELAPGARPDAQNFPARNRIISGMSLAVVVVEAARRSGALITAGFAADQGRDVFVVPGSVFAQSSEGANALVRDGARLVRDGADVLEDLSIGAKPPRVLQSQLPLSEAEHRLIAVLSEEALHIDELADAAKVSAAEAGHLLLTLELKGLARNQGAQYYVRP